jgi:membrane-associated protease RseP (regulator of RpoE activity)
MNDLPRSAGPTRDEILRSVGLFILSLLCVFWVYDRNQPPGADSLAAAMQFSAGLMCILLAHELGHYIVARRHGFELTLPYFIPVPFFLGTFGAVIGLRSLPRTRTALLEMGAAGPFAGFAVAAVLLFIGLPMDTPKTVDEVVTAIMSQPVDPIHIPDWLVWILQPLNDLLEWAFPTPPNTIVLSISHEPLIMDLLSLLTSGRMPGRYDELSPLSQAGWFGCMMTAVNLMPIGQLDGGHIANALAPRLAPRLIRPLLLAAVVAGVLVYPGWLVWALIIRAIGAAHSIDVPTTPTLTTRARVVAVLAAITFALTFIPKPLEIEYAPIPTAFATSAVEGAP